MDRELAFGFVDQERVKPAPTDPDLFPSRREGRAAIQAAMLAGRGSVLLTGEPGVGKTTLWRSLEAERPAGMRWLAVEMSIGTGAEGLYRLIGHALRVDPGPFGRLDLLDLLADRASENERWTLAVEDAQNLDAEAIDEIRILSGRIGEPGGFAAILIVGQSPLARRLALRSGAGLASRIAAHVHLRPLDADEVGLLLRQSAPDHEWPTAMADRVHLLASGLPGRVAEIAARTRPQSRIVLSPTSPTPLPQEPRSSTWEEPLLGPSKPPIRVEDGLIEVGWEPEIEDPSDDGHDVDFERTVAGECDGEIDLEVEERINDHYAALQAWQEWAANQGRHVTIEPETPAEVIPDDIASPLTDSANVWADEEHGFAPFGRLFARQPHVNEAE